VCRVRSRSLAYRCRKTLVSSPPRHLTPLREAGKLLSSAMAPEFGETQAHSDFGDHVGSAQVQPAQDQVTLPSMDDLDTLVAELDRIDATLAGLG